MKKVLLIEDDVMLCDDLKFFIEDDGNKCTVFDSSTQVIDSIDSIGDHDIIILDIMMMKGERIREIPKDEETGEELYRRIREKYPNMKFIVLSAKDFSKMKIDFRKERGVQILSKPVVEHVIKDLLDKIRSI